MKILAIETSCDDTCVAVIEAPDKNGGGFKILSSIVSSQTEAHKKYGGVYPMLAKREHQNNLVPVLISALKQAKLLNPESRVLNIKYEILNTILKREPELLKKSIPFLEKYKKPDVDLISVTNGPGLEPCLWVGVNFAKVLSYFWNIPVAPVNHIEAHILVNFSPKINEISNFKFQIAKQSQNPNFKTLFPAICLVVSGGHTQLILMKGVGKYKVVGETRDDAAGECFDKTARILGLGYPGGPAIAKLASQWKSKFPISNFQIPAESRASSTAVGTNPKSPFQNLKLPRPMINTKDYDFSFSGLKTAVLYEVTKKYGRAPLRSATGETTEGRQYIKQMCVEIQQAIIDVLIKKTIKAAKDFRAKTIILGGGVSANDELRKQFAEKIEKEIPDTKYLIPDAQLCTDNALMVALTGYFRYKNGKMDNWKTVKAYANLRI